MIDLKLIKEKKQEIAENIKNRRMNVDLDKVIRLSDERLSLLSKAEMLRSRRNEVASLMKQKLEASERQKLIDEGKSLKDEIANVESSLEAVENEYYKEAKRIPNFSDGEAPIGAENDGDTVEIKKVGVPRTFSFKPLDHVELGKINDLIDFDTATKVSGNKFYYLKNEAVLLELALVQYAFSIVSKHGFTPIITPDVAKTEILEGIGFSPRGEESNIYALDGMNECLVGTAEITLGGYYANQILKEDDFPIRFVGLSHCFRREAGGAGQFSKGLYRVHQFTKVEMFAYTLPQNSKEEHKNILAIEEEIFSGLGLAYRVVDTPTADLGAPAARKFDIEAWLPGRGENGEYGEVTSCSNCLDYQARSLSVRYKDKNGKINYCHTLNGTAVAISRALVAILENYQNEDHSITIPQALIPYMCGITKIGGKKN